MRSFDSIIVLSWQKFHWSCERDQRRIQQLSIKLQHQQSSTWARSFILYFSRSISLFLIACLIHRESTHYDRFRLANSAFITIELLWTNSSRSSDYCWKTITTITAERRNLDIERNRSSIFVNKQSQSRFRSFSEKILSSEHDSNSNMKIKLNFQFERVIESTTNESLSLKNQDFVISIDEFSKAQDKRSVKDVKISSFKKSH